jgi:hypothetical protein
MKLRWGDSCSLRVKKRRISGGSMNFLGISGERGVGGRRRGRQGVEASAPLSEGKRHHDGVAGRVKKIPTSERTGVLFGCHLVNYQDPPSSVTIHLAEVLLPSIYPFFGRYIARYVSSSATNSFSLTYISRSESLPRHIPCPTTVTMVEPAVETTTITVAPALARTPLSVCFGLLSRSYSRDISSLGR